MKNDDQIEVFDFTDGVTIPNSAPKRQFHLGWADAKLGKKLQPDLTRFYYLGYNSAKALSHNDWERIWEVVKIKS